MLQDAGMLGCSFLGNMDDLLALMGEGPDGPPPAPAPAPSSGSRSNDDERQRQHASSNQAHHVSSSSVEAAQRKRRQDQSTLDPLTNLRITNRRTSRFDLSDALAPHEFLTTARLAAMSTRDLDRYITQPSNRANDNSGGGFSFGAGPAPSSNANNNFTGGKSNLATMGVLFSNSGSKVSPSTGRAYSIFQLGDLSTGPAVSVFLFGDAYSKHTGNGSYAGRAGSVVAILSPNILPPKRGGATAVSLSVNSADQIVHVGTAQDYGMCSGMIRVRREGHFVDTRCTKFVDKRCGQFCQAHKRQGLQQQVGGGNRSASSSAAAGLKKNATFLQQFRAEGRSNNAGVPRNNTMASSGQQGTLGTSRGGMQSSSNLASALAAAGMDHGTTGSVGSGNMAVAVPVSTNAMLQQQGGGRNSTLNAPRHMVKTSIPGVARNSAANAIPRAAVGAAASTKLKRPPLTRAGKDVFGDTMRRGQAASGKTSAARTSLVPKAKPKERKVATFGGYSGSVQVPKPSRSLFGDVPAASGMSRHLAGSASVAVTPSSNPADLRERQRQIAEQMRKRKHNSSIDGASCGGVPNPYLRGASKATTSGRVGGSTQGQMDDIFAGLEDLDRADAIAAKSSYQSEADAEQYARSRQVVNDLERKETQKNARDERKKKQTKGRDEKAIQVQWICTTCGRESASQLVVCQTKNHKVKRKRMIKEATTKEESRDKLNKKRAEDGGLQLGSGLEWSGFRGA